MKNINIKIKLITVFVFGLFITTKLSAQQSFTIDASQVVSTFSFKDSSDPKNFDAFGTSDYNPVLSGAYSFGYRNTFDLGLIVRGSIGMRKAGATTIIDETNYQWDLQYVVLKAGAGYEFLTLSKLGVYATLSPYISYLMKANQRLDNEDYDIKKSGEIKTVDYGLQLTPGIQFTASDFVTIYGEVSYIQGLTNLEAGNTEQNSYNIAYAFTLGLSFTIE